MIRRVFLDHRIRFVLIVILLCVPGMIIQVYLIPHYLAPYTAAFYLVGLQAMRHLRVWKPERKLMGLSLVRMAFPLCLMLALIRLFSAPLGLSVPEWPASNWSWEWYGPDHYGTERAEIEAKLDRLPGNQLAIVRFGPQRDDLDQWVYNAADIDASHVIWAREMDPSTDQELLRHYSDRTPWLVRMDTMPATLVPYPLGVNATVSTGH